MFHAKPKAKSVVPKKQKAPVSRRHRKFDQFGLDQA
jgi:hypothetical protein